MQGSSALQEVLGKVNGRLAVFAVWEPILASDVAPPTTGTLALMHDPRAWQLWDPDHLVSDAIRDGMRAHPSAIALDTRRTGESAEGVLWDAVAVFPAGERWEKTMPAPIYLDGIVVDIIDGLQKTLRAEVP